MILILDDVDEEVVNNLTHATFALVTPLFRETLNHFTHYWTYQTIG